MYEFPEFLKDKKLFKSVRDKRTKDFIKWCKKLERVVIKQEESRMYPMFATAPGSESCYSFLFNNNKRRPTFLARTAQLLGCNPHLHYKKLVAGESVKLDDGTVVTPDMVMGKPPTPQSLMTVFLPGPEFIESFIEENFDIIDRCSR